MERVINRFKDDRGVLTQILDSSFKAKRCYEIKDRAGVIRAWHGHKREKKLIYVSEGLVKIIMFPMEHWEKIKNEMMYWLNGEPIVDKAMFNPEIIILSDYYPSVLEIPAGYYHGFKSLTDSNIIIFSSMTLEQSKKDDYRISSNELPINIFETGVR